MDNKRSPNYPSIGLTEAIGLVRDLWAREKRSQVPPEVVAKAWGYKGENGLSRMKVASLKKFGLLEGRGSNGLRLTDLATVIVTYPMDSSEYQDAVQESALNPELFRDVYQTHAHASDENLRAYLITKRGFSDGGATQFVKAFRETIGLVNPDQPRYNEQADPVEMQPPPASIQLRGHAPSVIVEPAAAVPGTVGTFNVVLGPLSVSVRVAGEQINSKHLELVRQYLAVAEAQLKLGELKSDPEQS